ncbi:2-amino-4-hydroxy-6-hydroxymethyldihydropteridine diphosphokinase [Prauserella flavalba]|uniref:2-amino-4-hydroxy-6-hydroxymethyldihydropteridine diphosphokinase n=1 Tax=Prauserella flavalba TaxID=1477506 RepID=A0A318LMH2_9PSEU|nr:2-amino-4-hydroxy-6-hydroxymethyldihydropteridine diphosphokinase [Prauserella flavalba]PXY17994.1 2-amino-4-hydroxy-6-hydroxymethyldihydropteridine diphosphokinase [Prauserella flavalba]
MSRAVLSLGSNLGDRLGYLRLAVDGLRDVLVAVSGVYETAPWGVEDQPDFLNAVCIVDDPARDHWAWLRTGQALERQAERVREQRWGPRTLDVDVVTVDGVRSDDPELLLPHPGTADRATVLIPWLEIDPAAEVPGRGRAADLLAALPDSDREGVRRREDLTL